MCSSCPEIPPQPMGPPPTWCSSHTSENDLLLTHPHKDLMLPLQQALSLLGLAVPSLSAFHLWSLFPELTLWTLFTLLLHPTLLLPVHTPQHSWPPWLASFCSESFPSLDCLPNSYLASQASLKVAFSGCSTAMLALTALGTVPSEPRSLGMAVLRISVCKYVNVDCQLDRI